MNISKTNTIENTCVIVIESVMKAEISGHYKLFFAV